VYYAALLAAVIVCSNFVPVAGIAIGVVGACQLIWRALGPHRIILTNQDRDAWRIRAQSVPMDATESDPARSGTARHI
jgi:hypothetical protein